MSGTDDNHVESDFKPAKLPSKACRLGTTLRHLFGLDDKQIEVRVGTSITPGAGTEEDHSRSGRSGSETATCLFDEELISHWHSPRIVVGTSDSSGFERDLRFRSPRLEIGWNLWGTLLQWAFEQIASHSSIISP